MGCPLGGCRATEGIRFGVIKVSVPGSSIAADTMNPRTLVLGLGLVLRLGTLHVESRLCSFRSISAVWPEMRKLRHDGEDCLEIGV